MSLSPLQGRQVAKVCPDSTLQAIATVQAILRAIQGEDDTRLVTTRKGWTAIELLLRLLPACLLRFVLTL